MNIDFKKRKLRVNTIHEELKAKEIQRRNDQNDLIDYVERSLYRKKKYLLQIFKV